MTSVQVSIINAIKTPLGFFSLIVLVVESALVGLALSISGTDRTFLLYAITFIIIFLILLVALISSFKPEALWGKRYSPFEESFAVGLGEELFVAFDGYLSNLEENTREEAYRLLLNQINTSPHVQSEKTKEFCKSLVETIIRRAKLKGDWKKTIGIAEP